MSTPRSLTSRGANRFPTMPRGEVAVSYDTYQQAQEAVGHLVHADFPLNNISIVGGDIKSVERVTGRMSYGRVALLGAVSGSYLGFFLGILFFLFQPENSSIVSVFFAPVIICAGFGMLFGVLSHSLNRNRREYSSVMQLIASRYDVVVDPDLVNRARNVLQSPPR
ncbi:general stress protein [Klugiella xanthotipulae]|nr:general stress protein [Klugiella xanthotipulae]